MIRRETLGAEGGMNWWHGGRCATSGSCHESSPRRTPCHKLINCISKRLYRCSPRARGRTVAGIAVELGYARWPYSPTWVVAVSCGRFRSVDDLRRETGGGAIQSSGRKTVRHQMLPLRTATGVAEEETLYAAQLGAGMAASTVIRNVVPPGTSSMASLEEEHPTLPDIRVVEEGRSEPTPAHALPQVTGGERYGGRR